MANNQEPRILIFSTTYLPFIGGAELAVKEITDRVKDFEFDLITAQLNKNLAKFEKMGNVNIYRVGRGWILDKYLFPWLAYFKAKKLHREKDYQIVQAIMAFYAGLAALFFKWRYPQVKYLLTMQSGDSDFFIWLRTWFWYPLYKKIYTEPDYIQAISSFLVKRAEKYGYRGKIEIVPNGVDLTKFSRIKVRPFDHDLASQGRGISRSDLEIRHALRIKPDEKIIMGGSRLVKKNGLDDLIKTGQYLNFPYRILLMGDGSERNNLESIAQRLKIEDKIIFIGKYDNDDLSKYLSIADVFVRPSLSEGLGSAFLEAMAAGLPVIGTPVGGIPDFLKDEQTGLFCQVNNPKDIAEKILYILDSKNKEQIEEIKENAKQMVENKYNWDLISEKMRKIFKGLIFFN